MSHHIPEAGVWCLIVALAAVVVLLVRQRTVTTALRARAAALEENVRARDEEAARLVDVRLPAVADSMDRSEPLPGLLDERLTGTAFAHSLQAVMELFAQSVDKAQERADQSAKAALRASMRALQGLAHEQQQAISGMQERHDDPAVLRDLLEIDHTNSQFGRRAQAIGVLCGSWPGRQRVASPLTDVVRGATSRIRDYRRVRVHGDGELAVVSRAVEPVVLAVAELLDNAARHSQPNTTVEVSLQPVHNGACVLIDDAGVGMDGQEIDRAVALLSGHRAVDVSRLGDPPQFGFPVVGVLAARYGFSVSVDTRSPYGGVRAVVFLPTALLTHLELDGPGTTPLAAPRASGGGPARGRGRARGGPDGPAAGFEGGAPGGSGPLGVPAGQGRPSAHGAGGDPVSGPGDGQRPSVAGRADSGPSAARPSDEPPSAAWPSGAVAGGPSGDGTFGSGPGAAASPAPPGGARTPAEGPAPSAGTTAGGLPKRRRRRPAGPPAGSAPLPPETRAPVAQERTAEETARRMGAFARGTRSGRAGRSAGTADGTVGPAAGAGRYTGAFDSSAADAEADAERPLGSVRRPADDTGRPVTHRPAGGTGGYGEAADRSFSGSDWSAARGDRPVAGSGRAAEDAQATEAVGEPVGNAGRPAADRSAAARPAAGDGRTAGRTDRPAEAAGRHPETGSPRSAGSALPPAQDRARLQDPARDRAPGQAPERTSDRAAGPAPRPGEAPGPGRPAAPGAYPAPADPYAGPPGSYTGAPRPYPAEPGGPAVGPGSYPYPSPHPHPHPQQPPAPGPHPAAAPAEDEGNPHA